MDKQSEWSSGVTWAIDRILLSAALGLVAGGFVAIRSYVSMRRVTERASPDILTAVAAFVIVFVLTILISCVTGNPKKREGYRKDPGCGLRDSDYRCSRW